jgi:hypothetical protein
MMLLNTVLMKLHVECLIVLHRVVFLKTVPFVNKNL